MEITTDKSEEEHNAVENRVGSPMAKLRKYTYVLPSGRILKVVMDDESELMGGAA